MNPPSAGVRAVLWPGRTKREYKPRAWDTSHKPGAVYKINTRRRGQGGGMYHNVCTPAQLHWGIQLMPRIQAEHEADKQEHLPKLNRIGYLINATNPGWARKKCWNEVVLKRALSPRVLSWRADQRLKAPPSERGEAWWPRHCHTWEVHASPVCRCEGSAVAWQDQSGVRATSLEYEPQARGCKRDTLRRQDYAHPTPEATNRDCKYGRPFRPASDLGHSHRLVAVTWIYESLSNLQVVASSVPSGTKPNPAAKNTATKLGNHLCMATEIGGQG